jgi:hypothetical protein
MFEILQHAEKYKQTFILIDNISEIFNVSVYAGSIMFSSQLMRISPNIDLCLYWNDLYEPVT